jgi:formylglycine-generating enzyme required for sulfatase activity
MRKVRVLIVFVCVMATVNFALADTFGTGANQFTIDFVPISGDASSANDTFIGSGGFIDPGYGYRIGVYEITNDMWTKFINSYGPVIGAPLEAYDQNPVWAGSNVPTNCVSWYEAAQFVNWLNTSTGHHAAYKFTGTEGTNNYTLGIWDAWDAWGWTNHYRHKDAYYFLPTDNEWVKAAYWNGTSLQTYATPDDTLPIEDVEANYGYESGAQPWNIGSGSEELNGTFDMMGNVWEWMEGPLSPPDYGSGYFRDIRGGWFSSGGHFNLDSHYLRSTEQDQAIPYADSGANGFRVASIPEPATILLLSLGGLLLRKHRR